MVNGIFHMFHLALHSEHSLRVMNPDHLLDFILSGRKAEMAFC